MGYPILSTPCSLWPLNTPPLSPTPIPPGYFLISVPTQKTQWRRNANTHTHNTLGIASSHHASKDSKTSADQVNQGEEDRHTCVWKHKSLSMQSRTWDRVCKVSDTVCATILNLQILQKTDRGRGIKRKKNNSQWSRKLADLKHIDALLALMGKNPKPTNVPMESFLGNFKTDRLLSWREIAQRIVCPEESALLSHLPAFDVFHGTSSLESHHSMHGDVQSRDQNHLSKAKD